MSPCPLCASKWSFGGCSLRTKGGCLLLGSSYLSVLIPGWYVYLIYLYIPWYRLIYRPDTQLLLVLRNLHWLSWPLWWQTAVLRVTSTNSVNTAEGSSLSPLWLVCACLVHPVPKFISTPQTLQETWEAQGHTLVLGIEEKHYFIDYRSVFFLLMIHLPCDTGVLPSFWFGQIHFLSKQERPSWVTAGNTLSFQLLQNCCNITTAASYFLPHQDICRSFFWQQYP